MVGLDDKTAMASAEPGIDWYIVHTYSGQEDRVKRNLEMRIESMDVKDKIFQVVVPTEDEIEIKEGKRRHVQRKIFPGYILVQMRMDDQSWYVVRNMILLLRSVNDRSTLALETADRVLRLAHLPVDRVRCPGAQTA